jgi:hypothetical protein
MKKTLVALAALAATGAFAQVAVTGTLSMGYKAVHTAALNNGTSGSDTSGLGIENTTIRFQASEDLGGGTKVTATMGLGGETGQTAAQGMNRGFMTGGDTNLTVDTASMGKFQLDTSESPDFITRSTGNAGGADMAGKMFAERVGGATDVFIWSYPITSSVVFQYDISEAALEGLGAGSQGSAAVTAQRQSQYRVNYSSGPVALSVRYATYDSSNVTGSNNNRVRFAGTYDLGVVKMGAAYSQLNNTNGGSRTDTGFSIGVPMGALKLGANVVQRQTSSYIAFSNTTGVATNYIDQTVNGYGLTADYALSKQTSINLSYASWNQYAKTAATGESERRNDFTLLLTKNF